MSLLNPPTVAFILLSITFVVSGMLIKAVADRVQLFRQDMGNLQLARIDTGLLGDIERSLLRSPFMAMVPLVLLQVALFVRIIVQNFCPNMSEVLCVLDWSILLSFLGIHVWLWIAQMQISLLAGPIQGAAPILAEPETRRLAQPEPPGGGS